MFLNLYSVQLSVLQSWDLKISLVDSLACEVIVATAAQVLVK